MRKLILFIAVILFVACDATKRVPEGSYLLDKVQIKSDVKAIGKGKLKPYLRQRPNSSIPVLGKVRLHMYNIPDNDSTWLNRMLLKYGEPQVLYNDNLTGISAEQMRLYMSNKGYLNAEVDTTVVRKDKKATVSYSVTGNDPYLIRNYSDTIHATDTTIYNLLTDRKLTEFIKEKDIFDLEVLDKGRTDMATELRNRGYYNFTKDNFYFLADTTVGTHQVDLTLRLNNPTDSTTHKQHYIGNVLVYNGVDRMVVADSTQHHKLDTTIYRGMTIVSEPNRFLSDQAIFYNTLLRPGRLYSDRIVERSYSRMNNLGPVGQSSINLTPVVRNDTTFLDATIGLIPGNLHYMQFGVDGTHSAGDLGVAANYTYEHRNLFKGGETLRFRINGAYEFITPSDSANLIDKSFYEYGADVFLSIPQLLVPWLMQRLKDQPSASTEYSIGANFQKRPEYLRQFFSLSSRFQWASLDWRLNHVLEPLGITYVRMPWYSDSFADLYLNDDVNPILRYSYDEQLIVRSSYTATFNNASFRFQPRTPFRLRAGVEVAGWIPRLVTAAGGSRQNPETGFQEILKIPYAEYVKGDLDFAITKSFDDKNALAGHIAIGTAYPYGNSVVMPFEKRYYGGGANSVRGWSTRTLGPGTYNSDSLGYDFGGKVGEIKLDMSVEYRRKLTNLFELATFVDAGNIWTIKDYAAQPGGYFQFSEFYKQIAVAYGLGLRLDLNFLLLRLDFGMKAHNPALPVGERWTVFKPQLRRDLAFHFAIGYPF